MTRRRADGHGKPVPVGPATDDGQAVSISAQLSDFEYALIIGASAFYGWVERCMSAAGRSTLAAQDVLILHAVNHRARGRRLADICMVMHVEDTHVISYSLKKLVADGLVAFEKIGRERHYATTARGDELCSEYRRLRETIVVRHPVLLAEPTETMASAARLLRTMAALYDQAARLATVERAPMPHTSR